jgi:site-specific recombinase XerD
MGQLRDKMERDLLIANYSPKTIRNYLIYARLFAQHYMRSPAEMGEEEIKNFLLHVIQNRNISYSTYRQIYAALKFLYKVTLGRPFEVERLQFPKSGRKLPVILSGTEVQRLLGAIENPKYKAVVTTIYATGMRISEACRLKVEDIDSARMVILIRNGKGRKDRYVLLSNNLLIALRKFWLIERPKEYLFPGNIRAKHISPESVRLVLRKAALDAGLRKDVRPHILRHTFATHMIEMGVDVTILQRLMGHASVTTTMRYLHLSTGKIHNLRVPFDLLGTPSAKVLG